MMKTITKKNFLYTFSKAFFLASTLCIFSAYADEGNTAKESQEALAKDIQKLKEGGAINIIIQNEVKSDVKSDANSGSPTSPSATPEKPSPKFKLGGTLFASATIQVLDFNKPLAAHGGEGGFCLFGEYKPANFFGVRSGIVVSKSSLKLPDAPPLLAITHVSVPITACFYPGTDRQWCLFVGPRFGKAVKVKLLTRIEETTKKALEKRVFVFLDFGFDRESKKGFIFGLDGFGLKLGWNIAALF